MRQILALLTSALLFLAALREHLPADTPEISSVERAEVLKRRLIAYNRRMSPANISAP